MSSNNPKRVTLYHFKGTAVELLTFLKRITPEQWEHRKRMLLGRVEDN